jgi:hypothetical protein
VAFKLLKKAKVILQIFYYKIVWQWTIWQLLAYSPKMQLYAFIKNW